MRGDGVPVAPGMLDGEAVAAGVMKAEGAILGLFQETGPQDPQGVVHSENQWRHHGYHAYPGVDAHTYDFSSCFFRKFKKSTKRGFAQEMTYFFGFYGPKIGGGSSYPNFVQKYQKP